MNNTKFIEELMTYINTLTTCYYEKASVNGSYPFCVLLPPSITDLSVGDLVMIDIEIYANELTGVEEIEELCDTLRNELNNYLLISQSNFNSHISFEGYYNLREDEQDLLARKLTFSARTIYM